MTAFILVLLLFGLSGVPLNQGRSLLATSASPPLVVSLDGNATVPPRAILPQEESSPPATIGAEIAAEPGVLDDGHMVREMTPTPSPPADADGDAQRVHPTRDGRVATSPAPPAAHNVTSDAAEENRLDPTAPTNNTTRDSGAQSDAAGGASLGVWLTMAGVLYSLY